MGEMDVTDQSPKMSISCTWSSSLNIKFNKNYIPKGIVDKGIIDYKL